MRVVTGTTSNASLAGGERSGSISPLELTPPVLDGSSQIKVNQGKSSQLKVKETVPPADFRRLSKTFRTFPTSIDPFRAFPNN